VCFVVLLVHSAVSIDLSFNTVYWYSSTSVDEFNGEKAIQSVDFRGCYEEECIYLASQPLFSNDKILAPFEGHPKLWVMSDSQNTSLIWIFDEEFPMETDTTLWIFPVPQDKIIPSHFDAQVYDATLKNDHVAFIVDAISETNLRTTVERLSSFHSRNSLAPETRNAAIFLISQLDGFKCQNIREVVFRTDYARNVICEIPGSDLGLAPVWVGAHYDSRGPSLTSPTQRAPGADDNGTGSAGLLEILRAISALKDQGIDFKRTISFAFWAGEEQGLFGSDYTALRLNEVHAYVNLDMIGYPQPNAPNTLYWMNRNVNTELTNLGIEVSKTYLGESTVVTTSGACCSDQQSFNKYGFPAAGVLESLAYTNNPYYHQVTDLPDTVTFSHVQRNTQMAAALVGTVAEPPETKKY